MGTCLVETKIESSFLISTKLSIWILCSAIKLTLPKLSDRLRGGQQYPSEVNSVS